MVLWHWIYNFVISTMQSQSLSTTSNKLFHYKAIFLILWFIWCDILHVRHARCIKLRAMVMFGLCFFSHFEFYRVRINTWQSQTEHFDFFDPNLCHLVECKSSLKNLLHPFDIAYLMSRVSWLACLGQWDDLLKVGK